MIDIRQIFTMFSETDNRKTIQLIKGKESIAGVFFTSAIVLELIVMMTDHMASWILPYRGRVTHVAFLLFCVKILMTKYNYKQLALMVLFGIVGTISYCTCKDEYVIRAIVFVFAGFGEDITRNLKIVFWGTLIGTLIIVLLALLGICGDIVDVRHYGRGVVEARYCLGFNHANNLHCMFWYLIVIYLLYKRTIPIKGCVICLFFNIVLYVFTRSRTGILSVGITLLLYILMKYYQRVFNRGVFAVAAILELIVAIALTVYAAIYLAINIPILNCIDKLLTGRLEMVSERAYIQLWELFPSSRPGIEVDNAFASITYSYGIFIGMVFIFVILYSIFEKYYLDDRVSLLVLMSVIGIFFMEATYIFNISLLCNVLLILLLNHGNEEMYTSKIGKKNEKC